MDNTEEKFSYYIYLITNLLNGKQYVGQHRIPKNGEDFNRYMGKEIAIVNAIRKYGKENFKKEIIESIEDNDAHHYVSEREIYWIKEKNTMYPNGYNLTPGGEGGCTKETAAKVIATRKRNHSIWHSEETRKKMSIAAKNKQKSEQHKKSLSLHHRTRRLHIIAFEDGRENIKTFDSIRKIANTYGINSITLKRYSSINKFLGGIKLLDCVGENTVAVRMQHDLNDFYYKDPIIGDLVTYKELVKRRTAHLKLYKGVISYNCKTNIRIESKV